MILLEHPDIKGITNVGNFKGCILLNSVDFTIGTTGSNKNMNNRRIFSFIKCSTILISRQYDDVSPAIVTACMNNKVKDVKIRFIGDNNLCYLEITLKDCAMNNYKFSCHGNYQANENFYLTFNHIEFRNTPEFKSGRSPMGAAFDLIQGSVG